jgi:predicted DNA binding CopG/RHH family protein
MKTPHRLHISLSTPQLDALKRESAVTGAPIAELVRRAIDEYLSRRTTYEPTKKRRPS